MIKFRTYRVGLTRIRTYGSCCAGQCLHSRTSRHSGRFSSHPTIQLYAFVPALALLIEDLKDLCHTGGCNICKDTGPNWQAVPAELQRLQKYKDLLLENTEKVLLSVHPVMEICTISILFHFRVSITPLLLISWFESLLLCFKFVACNPFSDTLSGR